MISKKRTDISCMDDFIGNTILNDNCQEEYFELKTKYEEMKKINEKIYKFSLEKILNYK